MNDEHKKIELAEKIELEEELRKRLREALFIIKSDIYNKYGLGQGITIDEQTVQTRMDVAVRNNYFWTGNLVYDNNLTDLERKQIGAITINLGKTGHEAFNVACLDIFSVDGADATCIKKSKKEKKATAEFVQTIVNILKPFSGLDPSEEGDYEYPSSVEKIHIHPKTSNTDYHDFVSAVEAIEEYAQSLGKPTGKDVDNIKEQSKKVGVYF